MGLDSFDAARGEPAPMRSDASVSVNDLVIHDLEVRRKAGTEKYGTELMTHNGRDALVDAYQECLDLAVYLRQLIHEKYGHKKGPEGEAPGARPPATE